MPVRLSCPSCNTAFLAPELPADRRVTCPRCADQFAVHTYTEVSESDVLTTATGPGAVRSERQSRARWSVMRAVMVALVMGLTGLAIGLIVYYWEGGFNPRPGPSPESAHVNAVIAPGQLSSLGYLPGDTNIAAVVQLAPIIEYARKEKVEPRQLLLQAGIPEKVLDTLKSLGLTLPQIEQIAAGTSIANDAVKFRLTLVVVLHHPVADEDAFRNALKARKHDGKGHYDVELAGLPMLMARVSPTVWVFGMDEKDLEAVDRGGYGPGGKQLPPSLALAIQEKLPPDAAVWLATAEDQWSEKPGIKLLLGVLLGKKEWLSLVEKGRAAVASLSVDDPPRVRIFLEATNETVANQLRNYFQRLTEKSDKARAGGAGDWAFFDAPFNPTTGLSELKRDLDAVGKQ